MLSVLLISLCLLSSAENLDHAIYISVLEIDSKQMKVKVFEDNLEDAIRNDSNSIEGYLKSKIKLQINGNRMSFNLKEITQEGDSYWITFSFNSQEKWQTVYLEASYLMELFPDQINVVKVIGEKPQFFRLSKSNPSCSFEL